MSGLFNDKGQYVYYGKVGGALITGNEDGVKHAAMSILYSLQHIGYTIPPAADAGWIGEVGPGPSYLDPGSGGPENDFTNRNTTFMTWNLLHLARMLKDAGGIPAYGNLRQEWNDGRAVRVQPRVPLGRGQLDPEQRTAAGRRMRTDAPAHPCDQPRRDRETQSRSDRTQVAVAIPQLPAVEGDRRVVGGEAGAAVRDLDGDARLSVAVASRPTR